MLQIIRDKKSFLLEVLCPIILVLIGLGVSSVKFIKNSNVVGINMNLISQTTGTSTSMYINPILFDNTTMPSDFLTNSSNYTYNYMVANNTGDVYTNLVNYNNLLLPNTNYTLDIPSYGSYYIIKLDKVAQNYEFVTFVNTQSKDGPLIYAQNMLNSIISYAAGRQINIQVKLHLTLVYQ